MPPRRRPPIPSTQEESVNRGSDSAEPNPMQQFVNMLAGAFMNPASAPTSTFRDFKAAGPPEFREAINPIEAQTWVMEMEKVFEVARVPEDQKTNFATFMLKGNASFWWQTNKIRGGNGVVPWDRFKEMFFETYFPPSIQDGLEVQFLELKQGDLTVSEYAAKFNELARFAPHQVSSEERKARRFEQGLKPGLYSQVSLFQLTSFTAVLEKALIAEGGRELINKHNQEQGREKSEAGGDKSGDSLNKRKWEYRSQNISSGWDRTNETGSVKKGSVQCRVCGKNHTGVCSSDERVCYNCGQSSHLANSCPMPRKRNCYECGSTAHLARFCPTKITGEESRSRGGSNIVGKPTNAPTVQSSRPTARTFNMTILDAAEPRDVVAGNILINSITAYIC